MFFAFVCFCDATAKLIDSLLSPSLEDDILRMMVEIAEEVAPGVSLSASDDFLRLNLMNQ